MSTTNQEKYSFNLQITVTEETLDGVIPGYAISEIEDLIRTHSSYYEHWELEDVESYSD